VVQRLPGPMRSAVTKLPESLQPAPSKTVRVVGVDDRGDVVRSYQGEIEGFHMLTGVRERDDRLYFGSLHESAVVTMSR